METVPESLEVGEMEEKGTAGEGEKVTKDRTERSCTGAVRRLASLGASIMHERPSRASASAMAMDPMNHEIEKSAFSGAQ